MNYVSQSPPTWHAVCDTHMLYHMVETGCDGFSRGDRERPQHVLGIFAQQMLGVACMLIANCFTILAG